MILRQAEHYLQPEYRLYLARKFVIGAERNIRQVLKYYANRNKNVEEQLRGIEELGLRIDSATDISTLMAIEGNIRDQYYRAFDAIHGREDFIFDGRTRRPPKNEINTLISFGNAIIYTTEGIAYSQSQ
jgi:CRISPR-associated protein Cas1